MKENMTKKRKQFKENLINHKKELGLHFFWQSESSVMYGCEKTWRKKMASCIILYYRFSLLDVQLETQLAGLYIFSLLFTDSRRKIFLRYKKVQTINCNCAIFSIFSFLALFCYSQFPDLIFLGLVSTNSIK